MDEVRAGDIQIRTGQLLFRGADLYWWFCAQCQCAVYAQPAMELRKEGVTQFRVRPVEHGAFRHICQVPEARWYIWCSVTQNLRACYNTLLVSIPKSQAYWLPASSFLKVAPAPALQQMPVRMLVEKSVPERT